MAKHLTEKERYQIEAWLKSKMTVKEIAELLNKAQCTIRREIKKGTIPQLTTQLMLVDRYCADVAHQNTVIARKKSGRKNKLSPDSALVSFLEQKIGIEKYSPDAVIGYVKKKQLYFDEMICTKTVYNLIAKGFFKNLTNKKLHIKKNKRVKKQKPPTKIKHHFPFNSIEDRLEIINSREELNHWEMDCVESSKGCKTSLLVFTERVSRYELIFKMPSKTISEVINVLDHLESKLKNKFRSVFKTITIDNGSEFKNPELIERSLFSNEKRTTAYYCHPYSSWERGSNENANRLIRYFIPKGSDIGKFTNKQVKAIQDWINNYPRKMFDYESANEVYLTLS